MHSKSKTLKSQKGDFNVNNSKRCWLACKGKKTPGSQVDIKVGKEGEKSQLWESFRNLVSRRNILGPQRCYAHHDFSVSEHHWNKSKALNKTTNGANNFLGPKLLISSVLSINKIHYTCQVSVLQNHCSSLTILHLFWKTLKENPLYMQHMQISLLL